MKVSEPTAEVFDQQLARPCVSGRPRNNAAIDAVAPKSVSA